MSTGVARRAQGNDGGDGLALVDQALIGLVELLLGRPGRPNGGRGNDFGLAENLGSGDLGPAGFLLVDRGEGHATHGPALLVWDAQP